MITFFILQSGAINADYGKTETSISAIKVEGMRIIRGFDPDEIKTPFYGLLYDNEYFSEEAIEAIPTFLRIGEFDCLNFWKKIEGKEEPVYRALRIFKSHVKINWPISLTPVEDQDQYVFEGFLNGFILGNADGI